MPKARLNPQAEELNKVIRAQNPVVFSLLSDKGRAIYFPKTGILGQTAEAKGTKINATIGIALEDDRSPLRLPSIAKKINLDPKDVFPYAPAFGKPELRQIWQKLIYKKNPFLKGKISLPVVTNALTHGLSVTGYLFVNPGDKILITDKFWGDSRLVFENAYGGVLETYNTFKNGHFDTESLEKEIERGTSNKIIILFNFPNNPAGYTPTESEAKKIVKVIKKKAGSLSKIVVILDDAYFGLVYEKGVFRQSLFSLLAHLHPNILAVKVDGATKEEYVWGLRVGFVTFGSKGITDATCQAMEAKTAGVVRGSISNASHLSQSLVLAALSSPTYQKEKRQKYNLLKSRYEKVKEVLQDKKFARFFTPLPYNSGYFMCLKLRPNLEAEKVRKTLIEKYDTGVIAIGNLLRIAYSSVAKRDIPALYENIYNACNAQII